jgi:phosphoglycerate dehydrogenase-like enzyme
MEAEYKKGIVRCKIIFRYTIVPTREVPERCAARAVPRAWEASRRKAMQELRDRVAVVTGGASGVGKALAKALLGEGMRVVLADVEEPALKASAEELGTCSATTPA